MYGENSAGDAFERLPDIVAPFPPPGFPGAQGANAALYVVVPFMATIKHPTFSEEREWRILVSGVDLPPDAQVDSRVGAVGIVPYLVRPFPAEALVEVVVGPGSYPDVRRNGVCQLLARSGLSRVTVSGSTSPLRL